MQQILNRNVSCFKGFKRRLSLCLACRIHERDEFVTVLLCGTSGCGKSTLSALLATRLGITTVISTDSIRHMMRSFVDEKQNPLLRSSTYHAGTKAPQVFLATHITYTDGLAVYRFLNSTRNPMAYITRPSTKLDTKSAPFMAAFSSKGPNTVTPEILMVI
ncbi:hypothetical protein L2E82_16275 [Cichorium intybus]|uniref:Uncharacterized protein n=1 Tax=Cichorium intybus TaxID=13427 RepID=A0ACB9F4F1_CICIN|nr:hypothetical protein L2E82_16275 [Cichorium intybus]